MPEDGTDAAARFPWYAWLEGAEIQQGDLLFEFELQAPVRYLHTDAEQAEAEIQEWDVVVLTQSCDIASGKVRNLVLSPCYEYQAFVRAARDDWNAARRDDLRKGNIPGYHLLNSWEEADNSVPLLVVDFHELLSAPLAYVREFARTAGNRPRLQPPYREHLAQAFARFFMRVGLPVDIPRSKLAIV